MYGELVPLGGGDPVPLLKKSLLVGRRESCDIVLRFANVSAHHCQLECHDGYWYVRDMNSKNGTRVNNVRVNEKRLDPGDELRVAKHKYRVEYSPLDLGALGPPPRSDRVQIVDLYRVHFEPGHFVGGCHHVIMVFSGKTEDDVGTNFKSSTAAAPDGLWKDVVKVPPRFIHSSDRS